MKVATNQERLNELFDSDPRNDTAIAESLNVSKQTISAWRKGIRSPKKPMLIRIAEIYNVSIEWLMGFDVGRNQSEKPIEEERKTTPEIQILARGMNKMTEEQQKQLLDVARIMFAKLFDDEGDE